MPSNRPRLKLDEQSFQGLLSAAFTIQEYNDRQNLARPTQAEPEGHPEPDADRFCQHCGALMPADASRCGSCSVDEFRPGERIHPNLASMLLQSQEQGLWPERPPEIREGARNSAKAPAAKRKGTRKAVKPPAAKRRPRARAAQDHASNGFLVSPVGKEAAKETIAQEKTETIHNRGFNTSGLDKVEARSQWITEATETLIPENLAPADPELSVQPFQLSATDDCSPIEARTDAATDASRELLNCVPNELLREIVKQAFQATHANGAVIALEQQGELICRAVAGDCASEIDTKINTKSGPTGVCASSGTVQSWSNTESESGVDAGAYRELGVSAVMVVPLFHQDQLLGVMEVLSRRPFAFGMRDRQALLDLAKQFTAKLQLSAEPINANDGQESPGVRATPDLLGGERNQSHFAGMQNFGLYTLTVIACVLIGFYWAWKLLDPVTNPAKGQVTLVSVVPTVPARLSHSRVVGGTLLHSVDPTYPMDALRQGIQGQVGLEIRISKDGLVYVATPIRGDPILSQAAVEAVRQWRFSPYRMNNKAYDVAAQITFKFSVVK
jgi:TonB family protein